VALDGEKGHLSLYSRLFPPLMDLGVALKRTLRRHVRLLSGFASPLVFRPLCYCPVSSNLLPPLLPYFWGPAPITWKRFCRLPAFAIESLNTRTFPGFSRGQFDWSCRTKPFFSSFPTRFSPSPLSEGILLVERLLTSFVNLRCLPDRTTQAPPPFRFFLKASLS